MQRVGREKTVDEEIGDDVGLRRATIRVIGLLVPDFKCVLKTWNGADNRARPVAPRTYRA